MSKETTLYDPYLGVMSKETATSITNLAKNIEWTIAGLDLTLPKHKGQELTLEEARNYLMDALELVQSIKA